MEYWDIYDSNKKKTGRTMKRNDWILQEGEYHLSVLGVIRRADGRYLITQRVMTKAWAPGLISIPSYFEISLPITERIRARETTILWMSICLSWILMRAMSGFRRKRRWDLKLRHWKRFRIWRHREFSCITTVSKRFSVRNSYNRLGGLR